MHFEDHTQTVKNQKSVLTVLTSGALDPESNSLMDPLSISQE